MRPCKDLESPSGPASPRGLGSDLSVSHVLGRPMERQAWATMGDCSPNGPRGRLGARLDHLLGPAPPSSRQVKGGFCSGSSTSPSRARGAHTGQAAPAVTPGPGPVTLLCLSFCTARGWGDDKARGCLMGLRGPVRWEQARLPGHAGRWDPRHPLLSEPLRGRGWEGRWVQRSPHTRTGECFFLVLAGRAAVAALFLLFNSLFYFMKTVQYFYFSVQVESQF